MYATNTNMYRSPNQQANVCSVTKTTIYWCSTNQVGPDYEDNFYSYLVLISDV